MPRNRLEIRFSEHKDNYNQGLWYLDEHQIDLAVNANSVVPLYMDNVLVGFVSLTMADRLADLLAELES